MYLSEFQVFNYKSFRDSGRVKLKPGFNILTGQNNAGKTALLEALSLRFQSKPHRSLTTTPNDARLSPSYAFLRVAVSLEELRSRLPTQPGHAIPVPWKDVPVGVTAEQLWAAISKQQYFQLGLAYRSHLQERFSIQPSPNSASRPSNGSGYLPLKIQALPDGQIHAEYPDPRIQHVSGGAPKNLGLELGASFASQIYSFRAERMNIGLSPFGSNELLEPNASNLPETLHVLQSNNPARFARFNQFVRRVFPQVEWISVRPKGTTQVEILVWSVPLDTERADLAIPLSESGTGISQVLAMLYVLVTAETPRTIIIDEPNSFLHPGAIRVLMEILREHPQHQYIISTHSPELISASNPSTVHLLRRKEGATEVESVDTHETQQLRTLLLEVGSRLSDVFGAESVLWVEGPTEQLCFPLIVQRLLKRPLAGVSIVGVLHTGDFDAKSDTNSVFRIYDRLTTQGSALMPPAIAFIFDRELRPERERADLERRSKGRVHFLGRRTYENYLLHAGAIAAVLNQRPPFTESPTSPEKVQEWIAARIHDKAYYGKANPENYPQDIDAPKLLDALFHEFSENRLAYNKVEHSLALTDWLLTHAPEELREIADLMAKVLPPPPQAPQRLTG